MAFLVKGSKMGDFADLLQEAEKITVDIEGTKELPKVDRSIRQVLEASNDLYTKVAQTGSKDIQAYAYKMVGLE
jgi:nuclear pore complex protein Nup93